MLLVASINYSVKNVWWWWSRKHLRVLQIVLHDPSEGYRRGKVQIRGCRYTACRWAFSTFATVTIITPFASHDSLCRLVCCISLGACRRLVCQLLFSLLGYDIHCLQLWRALTRISWLVLSFSVVRRPTSRTTTRRLRILPRSLDIHHQQFWRLFVFCWKEDDERTITLQLLRWLAYFGDSWTC